MDIERVLKKNKEQLFEQEQIDRASNRMLIFILMLVSIVFIIDYVLVNKFMEILNNFSHGKRRKIRKVERYCTC